jgi:hypothetical protein
MMNHCFSLFTLLIHGRVNTQLNSHLFRFVYNVSNQVALAALCQGLPDITFNIFEKIITCQIHGQKKYINALSIHFTAFLSILSKFLKTISFYIFVATIKSV